MAGHVGLHVAVSPAESERFIEWGTKVYGNQRYATLTGL